MPHDTPAPHALTGVRPTPPWLMPLLAAACGVIVANLYYAQPLIGPISAAIGLSPRAAGLIVTLTQLGYGAGLLLIVPLGDLFENRRLIMAVLSACVLALALAATASNAATFLTASLFIGLSSVAVQILVPYAAHLSPEVTRGRAVGNVMSGLLLGIMLARPASSFIADLYGWHAVFMVSTVVVAALSLLLSQALPKRTPTAGLHYGALLKSMGRLLLTQPVLRRRAIYHAWLFGAFSLFWTTVPLFLAGPDFRMSQRGIALFALAGVAGAVAAPMAGRIADRGRSRPMTWIAMLLVAFSFLLTRLGEPGSTFALGVLVTAGILLDSGVSANLVVSQRVIFSLGAEFRSRLNGLFMSIFFLGGAVGSALGAWAYAHGGWNLTAWLGFAMPVAALLHYATEK